MRWSKPLWLKTAILAVAAVGAISCASSGTGGSKDEIGLDPAAARALSGTWVFTMKDGDHETDGKLRFSFDGIAVSGAFVGQDDVERRLSNIQVAGGKVSWEMEGQRGTQRALGKADKDTMDGTLKRLPKDQDSSEGAAEPDRGSGGNGGQWGGHGGGTGGGHRHSHSGGGSRGGSRTITWTATRSVAADETPSPAKN